MIKFWKFNFYSRKLRLDEIEVAKSFWWKPSKRSVFLLETFQQSDDLSDYFVNLKHFPTFSKALEKDQKF